MANNIDAMSDAALNALKTNAIRVSACQQEPTTYAEITSLAAGNNEMGVVTISSTDFTGPAAGDTNGRKITFDGKAGMSITGTGTATVNYVVFHDNSAVFYAVATLNGGSGHSVTNGETWDVPGSIDIEIADPT